MDSAHDRRDGAAPTDEEVLGYLKQISRDELELRPEQVAGMGLDTPVVEGLQLDSLAQVILLSRIEEHYGFVFDLEDREELQTIQIIRELVGMIRRRAQGWAA
jgi:acyl carrier protein